jgi:hypothetical protein
VQEELTMACDCESCQKVEKLTANITPEVEQLLELLTSGVASGIQRGLDDTIPRGLSPSLRQTLATAALASLAEAMMRSLPKEQADTAARLASRVLATSEKLKVEHARRAAGGIPGAIAEALREAGFPSARVEVLSPAPPPATPEKPN